MSRLQGEVDSVKLLVNAGALRLVVERSGRFRGGGARETLCRSRTGERRERRGGRGRESEIHGEQGEVLGGSSVWFGGPGMSEAKEAILAGDDGGAEELVPVRCRDGQRGEDEGADAVRPGLGNETVEKVPEPG